MAALIGGQTVHACGEIPVNAEAVASKLHVKNTEGDVDAWFLSALGVRWMIEETVRERQRCLLW